MRSYCVCKHAAFCQFVIKRKLLLLFSHAQCAICYHVSSRYMDL